MSLTYGLDTPRALLEKLGREYARLDEQVTTDNFFNFVVTGYHIMDWVKNNPSTPAAAKAEANNLYSEPCIAMCRDLANSSKHFTLNPNYKGQVTERTSISSGYGMGRYGKGPYGKGEPSIVAVHINQTKSTALQLAADVVETWTQFFAKHGL